LSHADDSTFAKSFQDGVGFYKTKDYEKAKAAFTKALEIDPHNATALTNLALVEYQLSNKPLAIAFLRKALVFDPELSTARAGLKFAFSQLEVKEVPHKIDNFEDLRAHFLAPVPLSVYLILSALLLFAAGWTWLAFMGRRRRALEKEAALPPFPLFSALFSLGFFAALSLSVLKYYDSTVLRGTIISDKVSLQSAPGEGQTALLDLYGGFEVIVHSTNTDWVQVEYPGALTGWMKKSALFITSDKVDSL
jgi:tetratricopeptide (TPR) repeat protein